MIKRDRKRGVNSAFDESADSMLFHRSGVDDGRLFIKLHLSCVFRTACSALFFFLLLHNNLLERRTVFSFKESDIV